VLLVGPELGSWKGKRPDIFSYFVKLADFGAACKLAANEMASAIVGTPDYMSPEMREAYDARGAAGGAAAGAPMLQYNRSVDVFSSALVVAEMR
jgi:serine/threonine protein kinase